MKTAASTLILMLPLVVGGCVQRRLVVHSEPEGARVTIDGYYVGETPTEPIGFHFYGRHEIMLEKEGYEPLLVRPRIDAPWYAWFPIDFFSEVLWPGVIKDHRELSFKLMPVPEVDREALIARARAVRAQVSGSAPPPNASAPDAPNESSPEVPDAP